MLTINDMKNPVNIFLKRILVLVLLLAAERGAAQGFLDVKGKDIINEKGEKVILRGMGLGGWMLQEGYMLRMPGDGQQHRIRARIEEVMGSERTREFYDSWLKNHTTRADIDSMKAWGFNSVRLPMHYNLYTLPVEEEPVRGRNTWLERGFAMTDSLLAWCKANQMYLILDMHAAPGGQGNDFNISDRDPSKPSLWESEENRNKMIALWRKLAERYAGEPWIGAYDIINEPNWGFTDPEDRNGLKEPHNGPLKQLMVDITRAIRDVDQKHIIIIEGNGWGNNYNGILPPWDKKMVLSFHKYWNFNNPESIAHFIRLRDQYNVPVWLGETGENSNTWFTEAIALMESNGIGWCWWPLKKMGFNNPLEIRVTPGYEDLLRYWAGTGPRPSAEAAYATMMQMAENSRLENCIIHADVIDAMFRQVRSAETRPFRRHHVREAIQAVDYDLGRNRSAYFDTDTSEHYISTGTARTGWNSGRTYRNDGVDIARGKEDGNYFVTKTEDGEWLQYTVSADAPGRYTMAIRVSAAGSGGRLSVSANGQDLAAVAVTGSGENWQDVTVKNVLLRKGPNQIRLRIEKGGFNLASFRFAR